MGRVGRGERGVVPVGPRAPDLGRSVLIAWTWLPGCAVGCPPGTSADAEREQAARGALAADDPALAAVGAPVCFGGDADEVVDGRVVLRPGPEAEQAVALGHLLRHVERGLSPPRPGPGCVEAVARLEDAERRAFTEEVERRARWGLPPPDRDVEDVVAAYRARCR